MKSADRSYDWSSQEKAEVCPHGRCIMSQILHVKCQVSDLPKRRTQKCFRNETRPCCTNPQKPGKTDWLISKCKFSIFVPDSACSGTFVCQCLVKWWWHLLALPSTAHTRHTRHLIVISIVANVSAIWLCAPRVP